MSIACTDSSLPVQPIVGYISFEWLGFPVLSPNSVVLSTNDTGTIKNPVPRPTKGLRHLKQKSAFNLFSDKEKPFIAWFLLALFHLKRGGWVCARLCVCRERERESITHAPQPPLAHVPARATLYRGGGARIINADWLIALETERACARIVLEQWCVPDWHFPPSLLRFPPPLSLHITPGYEPHIPAVFLPLISANWASFSVLWKFGICAQTVK